MAVGWTDGRAKYVSVKTLRTGWLAHKTGTQLVCQLCQSSHLPDHQRWYKAPRRAFFNGRFSCQFSTTVIITNGCQKQRYPCTLVDVSIFLSFHSFLSFFFWFVWNFQKMLTNHVLSLHWPKLSLMQSVRTSFRWVAIFEFWNLSEIRIFVKKSSNCFEMHCLARM